MHQKPTTDKAGFLIWQTLDTYAWVNRIINSIPQEKWDVIPDTVESNVTWQTGHLVMSFYFHSIMVIAGHQMDLLQKVPMKEYDQLFTAGSPADTVGKIVPGVLLEHMFLTQQKSIEIIKSLSPEDLESELEPTTVSHPIAKTKLDALDWNVKHTMYHCGQLGILKRILDERFDFGLRR